MFEDICFDLVYRTLLTMYYSKALLLSAQAHSGAIYAPSLHRIIEINLSLPMESNCGFGG